LRLSSTISIYYVLMLKIPWTRSVNTSPRRSLIKKDLCSCIIAVRGTTHSQRSRLLIINRNCISLRWSNNNQRRFSTNRVNTLAPRENPWFSCYRTDTRRRSASPTVTAADRKSDPQTPILSLSSSTIAGVETRVPRIWKLARGQKGGVHARVPSIPHPQPLRINPPVYFERAV